MPQLFALQGPGDCGKSETLHELFYALQSKYPSADIQVLRRDPPDIAVIMRGLNGLAVGIASHGDPHSPLEQILPALAAAKCDIIFCACRTRGMTVDWVKALSPAYNIHIVAQTVVASNRSATNTATVALLLQRVGI